MNRMLFDAWQVKAYRNREGKPDQLLGAAIISLSDLPADGRVQVRMAFISLRAFRATHRTSS